MSNFVYSNLVGKNDPYIGKYEHKIKALIEEESNAYKNKKNAVDELFNKEQSDGAYETTMGETSFGRFTARGEGQKGNLDSVGRAFDKTIGHVEFSKDFVITKKMMDDSKFGIAANGKKRIKAFVKSYYETQTYAKAMALINGRNASMKIDKEEIDLTTGDGLPLFAANHPYYNGRGTQSNLFRGDIASSAAQLETSLAVLCNIMRNFEDENHETMEYTGNVLILPSNRPLLEVKAKQVTGSYRNEGSSYINIQAGNWTVIVLPHWRTTSDQFMIMSSACNEDLGGNMFYDRIPLDITDDIEKSTRNLMWNGYCRFGLGFTTWKHMLLAVDSQGTGNSNVGVAVPELAYTT